MTEKIRRAIISDRLCHDREKRNKRKRCLSSRVVARFYRSPELLIKEKQYDQKIDIFSIGCIFAELLDSLEPDFQTNPSKRDRRILFADSINY